jgi:hypothetical protein
MVLVRKFVRIIHFRQLFSTFTRSYFRNKCEYVVSMQPSNSRQRRLFSRSHSTLMNISSPVAAFVQRKPAPMEEKDIPSPTPGLTFIHPTPGETLADNELTARGPTSNNNTEQELDYMLSDTRTFSTSPRPASLSISPFQSRSPHVVDFGISTSVSPSIRQKPISPKHRMFFGHHFYPPF